MDFPIILLFLTAVDQDLVNSSKGNRIIEKRGTKQLVHLPSS